MKINFYLFMTLILLCSGAVAHADRLGTQGTSQTFDADYEQVWNAALAALDDKTIESANKDIGQIVTKAEKGHNLTGDTSKSISVKISHVRPCKVMVHANVERTVQVGFSASTDTYSDDDMEKKVLTAIGSGLKK